jgi:hypothetical protein
MSTLPLVVSANTDVPAYFMRTDADDLTLLRYTPALPDGPFHWATREQVDGPANELTVGAVAQLLHHSGLEPDGLDDDGAIAVIARSLAAVHCDMTRCAGEVGAEIAEHVAGAAAARFNRCVLRAGRLLGTEA